MNYIKRESIRYDNEHDRIAKSFVYGIVFPAILAGSVGWGCYFANKYDNSGKNNVSCASEAEKPYLRTLPVSRYQR